ncbi:MAG: hypothetical protein FWF80_05355 [Defluviitaleaceae bacterium]|nr:hypothetical protein [Defluviitaleaceae bacterium]
MKNMANWKDENRLHFEPRKWQAEAHLQDCRAERVVITDPAGGMTEVWCLGDWHKHWSAINAPAMRLKKNTDYMFAFWLNGGENDRHKEVCQFKIYFDGDGENPLIFRLNRNYIKPTKYNGGWYRYEIPFNTGDSDGEDVEITLQFAAMDAHCAFMPDHPALDALSDEARPDPRIPQRHNIVFTDGWPRDTGWSYLAFGDDVAVEHHGHENGFNGERFATLQGMGFDLQDAINDLPPDMKADLIREIFALNSRNINR